MNSLRITVFVLACSILTVAQASPRIADVGASFADSRMQLPSWKNGLISVHRGPTDEGVILIHDENGGNRREVHMRLPGGNVRLNSAVVGPNGNLYVVGGSEDREGRIANFIGIGSSQGITKIVRTNPFVPLEVCATTESVWAYGWERSSTRFGREASAYPMLREFDVTGAERRQAINRNLAAGLKTHSPAHLSLRCTRDKVVLFLQGAGKLFLYDTVSNSLSSWSVARIPDNQQITGLAVTDSGEIFASITDWTTQRLFRLRRTGQTANWDQVGEPLGKGSLLGASGDELVILQKPEYQAIWKSTQFLDAR